MSHPVPNATAGTVLGFLLDGPLSGYALDAAIEGTVGAFWNVTRSQVYRELQRLVDAGLVRALDPGPRARTPHEITEEGRAAFRSWVADDLPEETRRLPVLLMTSFGDHLDPERLRELLEQHRAANAEVRARYEALEADLVDLPFALATVRFGLAYTELVDRWIEEEGLPLTS